MTDLSTSPRLLESLAAAVKRSLSEKEIRAQRISFIMSGVDEDSNITREQVEEVVLKLEGHISN